ncbi:EAL and HDOD domain-containing protein [Alteromonas sp. 14N.309.X.WAT.G.H12]|uniref:EAL and HDOD domain-containing protein n=1 Tax=Alteromonas sp. 14N.309.X.WAT.G.H12 TaxID=3120824 RepID=UPI002FCE9C5A
MDVVTARQAIVNKEQAAIGYELLFRDRQTNSFSFGMDPYVATCKLIDQTHLNFGLSELSLGKRAFINFSEKCLLQDSPYLMSPKNIVVEVLESVRPTDAIFKKVKTLFKEGYTIALDDFVFNPKWQRFLPFVQIIKVDISQMPMDSISPFMNNLMASQKGRKTPLFFLAERIETETDFLQAKEVGFDYFQGYYFSRPEMYFYKDVDVSQFVLMALYEALFVPDINMDEIACFFRSDEALTYKLQTYLNSGLFDVDTMPLDIKQALDYVGKDKIRRLVSLLVTSQMAKSERQVTYRTGHTRVRTCKMLATSVAP